MSALLREDLISALPYARRYARALTGGQMDGDKLVAVSLSEILRDGHGADGARLALYGCVTRRFNAHEDVSGATGGLSQLERQLLLLTTLEEVALADAAVICGVDPSEAARHLTHARDNLRDAAAADVLIIEDEPIIAMDIEELVRNCGHRVVGMAANETDAVQIALRTRPGLILADINLGVGGDGTSAVARILRQHKVPVIFVTAFPERLLTGETSEPVYIITKPFEPLTLAIATYQAVTGGVSLA
jgi:CheY-like chemotaxis protein/DNA-directed RNA polymerase specialized sigma24 family protein